MGKVVDGLCSLTQQTFVWVIAVCFILSQQRRQTVLPLRSSVSRGSWRVENGYVTLLQRSFWAGGKWESANAERSLLSFPYQSKSINVWEMRRTINPPSQASSMATKMENWCPNRPQITFLSFSTVCNPWKPKTPFCAHVTSLQIYYSLLKSL